MTDMTVKKELIVALQKKADELKGNRDGILEKIEEEAVSLFETTISTLKQQGKINDATYKEAMGLYTTSPVKIETSVKTEEVKSDKKAAKEAKKEAKVQKEVFEKDLKYLINNGSTRESLVADITEKLQANAEIEPYKSFIRDIDKYIDKKLEKQLENNKNFKDAYKTLEDKYNDRVFMLKTANPELTIYQAQMTVDYNKFLEEMKEELKDNGQSKKAIKAFEKNVLQSAGFSTTMKAISEQEFESWKKVRSEAKNDLKEDNTWNKYTKKALKGNSFENRITGESSVGKKASQAQANYVSVKNARYQTKDEVINTIGRELFERLKGAVDSETGEKLVKEEDGKYDINNLQEVLTRMVGKGDHEWSRHNKKIDSNTSEIARSQGQVTLYDALENCNKKDVENLIELCGIPKEKKDWYKASLGAIFGFVLGAANGAGAGAIAAATNPRQIAQDGDISVDASTSFELTNVDINSIDQSLLPEGTTLTQLGNSVVVNIDKIINLPGAVIKLSKMIGKTALKTGLISGVIPALAGFINGLKDVGEMEVFSKYITETDPEKYAKRVAEESPEYAPYAIILAAYFIENGKINTEEMMAFWEEQGGEGGKVNSKEMSGSILNLMRNEPPVQENCNTEGCSVELDSETTLGTCAHIREYGDTWKGLVEAYFPELAKTGLWGKDGAIKKFQRALCTDENGNFNKDKFDYLISCNNLPEIINIPAKIGSYKRSGCSTSVEVKAATADELNNGRRLDNNNKVKIAGVTVNGKTTYTAKDGCDATTATGATVKEAILALKEKTKKDYNNEDKYLK